MPVTKEEILKKLAPCGLNCEKCFAFSKGKIKQLSHELKIALENFTPYAKRFSVLLDEPVFNTYPYFDLQLAYFAGADCDGCRITQCKLFKTCKVRECSSAKKVDFCFQCDEFPCTHTGFDENLNERWIMMNCRMKAVGVKTYYLESRKGPRYK
jgi:hypothetical protein